MIKKRPLQKYTIGNKELRPAKLHGERYYGWFDEVFNLPSLAEGSTKQGSTPDKLIPASFRGKRFSSQDNTTAGLVVSCHPCTHHVHTEQSHSVVRSITVGFEPERKQGGDHESTPSITAIQVMAFSSGKLPTNKGSNPFGTIKSEQLGGSTPATLNTTATTGYSLGEGSHVPSPSSNSHIIEPETDLTTFSTMSNPHSLRFGHYSSSIPIIKSCEVLD